MTLIRTMKLELEVEKLRAEIKRLQAILRKNAKEKPTTSAP